MNYLELVQRTIRESGAHLRIPEELVGLDGLQSLFKDWVADAWREIQLERSDWNFRQAEEAVTLDPVTLDNEVIVPPEEISTEFEQDWRVILLRDIYVHDPSDDNFVPRKMFYVPWNRWPQIFGRTVSRREYNEEQDTQRIPRWFTYTPDGMLQVYPRPDRLYEIQFWAPKAVQYLEEDTDEPFLEEHHRMAIVYRALMEYALYHDDRSVFERARNKWRSYKKSLEHRYMPDMAMRTDQLYKDL